MRKPVPLSRRPSKISRDGRRMYWYSGAWRSEESIASGRKRAKEYQAKNRANRNAESAERYRCNKEYRERSLRHKRLRRAKNPVKCALDGKRHYCSANGIEFNLTEEWYLAHWSQGCEATGIDFEPSCGDDGYATRGPWVAEIDRKNHGGPYTMDNCRLVVAIYNRARMGYSDADVGRLAEALVERKR